MFSNITKIQKGQGDLGNHSFFFSLSIFLIMVPSQISQKGLWYLPSQILIRIFFVGTRGL